MAATTTTERQTRNKDSTLAGCPFNLDRRSSGVLLHLTCLPGPHGSGDLSRRESHRFIDFLRAAGQQWWQMLPVNPSGAPPGNSPYSASSSFAGSPWLVSLDDLARDGLLRPRELGPPPGLREDRVNYPQVIRHREQRLRMAHARFRDRGGPQRDRFRHFVREHRGWLDDFALYAALRARFAETPWQTWPRDLRQRKPAALAETRQTLADDIDYHRFVQYAFDRQWQTLRAYARRSGIGLIGDVPIFVSLDSADVWCNQELFQLDARGRPRFVSGVPPDEFSPTGQHWGHPQYHWPAHQRTLFHWWVERLRASFRLFDAMRIDHFLGFAHVWRIPAGSSTAGNGRWVPVPGQALLTTVRQSLGPRLLIAEDLGRVTPDAIALRDAFGLAGMRLLQMGLPYGDPLHRPHNFIRHCVAYPGTHDNDTIVGWFRHLSATQRRAVRDYAGSTDDQQIHWDLIRLLMASTANTILLPAQDLLGLGSAARMNRPGQAAGNWTWRIRRGQLTPALARRLRRMAELYDRLPEGM